jgi:hypothetical protein
MLRSMTMTTGSHLRVALLLLSAWSPLSCGPGTPEDDGGDDGEVAAEGEGEGEDGGPADVIGPDNTCPGDAPVVVVDGATVAGTLTRDSPQRFIGLGSAPADLFAFEASAGDGITVHVEYPEVSTGTSERFNLLVLPLDTACALGPVTTNLGGFLDENGQTVNTVDVDVSVDAGGRSFLLVTFPEATNVGDVPYRLSLRAR